ncbi:MAG: hypothetical protein KY476_26035, partial [Planctomycetes bacterium]|nr:hypothetical protein [Planctomycetota bacterium]
RIADGADDRTVMHITSGAERHTVYLSPDLVSFEKRLQIRCRGRQKYNNFPAAEIDTLLEDLRIRGDRQKQVWAKIEVE